MSHSRHLSCGRIERSSLLNRSCPGEVDGISGILSSLVGSISLAIIECSLFRVRGLLGCSHVYTRGGRSDGQAGCFPCFRFLGENAHEMSLSVCNLPTIPSSTTGRYASLDYTTLERCMHSIESREFSCLTSCSYRHSHPSPSATT